MSAKHTLSLWGLVLVLMLGLLTACQSDSEKSVTVGIVNLAPALDPIIPGFKEGLAELDYAEGENIIYVYDGAAGGIDKLEPAVQKLLDADVDLILALSTPATIAAQKITAEKGTPIVFVPVTDPVGAGVVDSMQSPGGNITGITFGASDAPRLEWLLKVAPTVQSVYIPYNPEDGSPLAALKIVSQAAEKLGVELFTQQARSDKEITAALADIPEDVDAIFLLPDSLVVSRATDFLQLAIERGLPMSSPSAVQVQEGALISYGFGFFEAGKQAAGLAHQILSGSDPGGLPVETAEYFLTINLKTAEAIGLEIPQDILRQADTLIR